MQFQKKVLAGLFSASKEAFPRRIHQVLKDLTEDFFQDRLLTLFNALRRYFFLTNERLPWEKLREALEIRSVPSAEIFEFQKLIEELSSTGEEDGPFRFSIDLLKELKPDANANANDSCQQKA